MFPDTRLSFATSQDAKGACDDVKRSPLTPFFVFFANAVFVKDDPRTSSDPDVKLEDEEGVIVVNFQ